MNVMEIRGSFISLLAEINDPDLLQQMLANCHSMLQAEDRLADLSPELLWMLEKAVAESDDLSDAIPNEKVKKLAYEWLKQ